MKLIASVFATLIASTFILTSVSLAAFIVQEDPAPPSDTAATPPADATDDDAVLESLPAPMQAQVKQMLAKLLTVKDPEKLRQALDSMDAQSAQMPEEAKPMFEYMKKKIQNRIDELTAAEATTETPAAATEETPATTETPAAATEETPAATETPAAATEETPATTETPAAAEAPAISAAVQKAIEDFLYGVLAGRKELAETNAKFILASDVSNQQLAQMLDDPTRQERLIRAVRAAKGMGEVGDLASQIEIRVAAGRLQLSRDQSRVALAVGQLNGTMRQQTMARATLTAAGAYAMPALLKAMLDSSNAQLALRASQTIIDIGRPAVLPLCVVLVGAAPQEQIAICNMLAAINQKTAAPWLVKTMRLAATSDVRNAAGTTLRALKVDTLSEQSLWTNLARDYFVSRDRLTPYPDDASQIVWSVDASGFLVPTLVPTQIYGDLMAQQCAQESMLRDSKGADALSIYLAAGLRIESVSVEGESSNQSIMSIALAAGPEQAERVLQLARQVNDPGLTLIAIHILSKTASESMLVDSKAGSPILGCLTNPSRPIRTAAALAIARALPKKAFQSSEKVVPILGAAVAQGRDPRTIVLAKDEAQRRELEGRLSQIQCVLLSSEPTPAAVLSTLEGRGAPDLIIASGGADEMAASISMLRSNPAIASTPIMLVIAAADEVRIDRAIRQDPTIVIWFQGKSDEQFQAAAKQLMARTIGVAATEGDGATESLALQSETLDVLRLIGELPTSPLKVVDAQRDLIDALSTTTAQAQTQVARVLAVMPTPKAQQALINAALAATQEQQIALLQALAESGRRYGNQAEEKQLDRLRQALAGAKGANADALAQAYGALNLGTDQVLKLILK